MLRSLDLNTSVEHSSVHAFTAQTVARLSPLDATLPQVLTICEMVKRGVGVVRNQCNSVRRFANAHKISLFVVVVVLLLLSTMEGCCLS
jgi:hypothetical protein